MEQLSPTMELITQACLSNVDPSIIIASLTLTPSPMVTNGPIATFGPILAVGAIVADGSM